MSKKSDKAEAERERKIARRDERQLVLPTIGGPAFPAVYRFEDLRALGIRYSRRHVRRLEADGTFPMHMNLSGSPGGAIGWERAAIHKYLKELAKSAQKATKAAKAARAARATS